MIDLAMAKRIVAAAEAAAVAGDARVAIAVVDANGDLVFFQRNGRRRRTGRHERAGKSARRHRFCCADQGCGGCRDRR